MRNLHTYLCVYVKGYDDCMNLCVYSRILICHTQDNEQLLAYGFMTVQ